MDTTVLASWRELAGWLDAWFEPDQAGHAGLDDRESEVFGWLSREWRSSEDKLGALEAASELFGRQRVIGVVRRLCAWNVTQPWRERCAKERLSLDDLLRLVWGSLPELGFEFTMVRDARSAQMRCTRCPHVDLAVQLEVAGYAHAREWLYELICSTDPYVTVAFDPPIGFSRTRTLMQGDDCCDHTYTLE